MSDIVALIEQDLGPGKRSGGWLFWRCPFHADDNPSLAVRNGRYYCFGCMASGDAVDWLTRYRNLPMREALQMVKGRLDAPKPAEPQAADKPAQDPQTVAHLTQEAYRACDALEVDTPLAQAVRGYLARRGLLPPTWYRALLGAAEVYDPKAGRKRPAVAIPYLNSRLDVRAVKYRFADDAPDGLRYTSAKGSRADLYWLPEKLGRSDTLLVVEGEINLLSVAQTLPDLDLVSTGSQSITDEMRHVLHMLARRYRKVYVWMDDGNKAVALAGQMRNARAVQSPVIDGRKWDANAMLEADMLHDFVERRFGVKCHGWRLSEWRARQN